MNIDESQFFKEITLRICGSLNLERALWHCFLYVHEVFPADELILTVYDQSLGALEVVATADIHDGTARSDKIPMSPPLRKQLDEALRYPRVRISDGIFDDPIVERIARHMGWLDSSMIITRLILEGRFVGSLIVRAKGTGHYTEEHARLWALVNEPAAIALANSRQYLELLRLKEILADDNRYFQEELRGRLGNEIIGAHFGLREVMDQVIRVAALPSPVLLSGETGTGKEVIANAIHSLSPRSNGPLIKVNCGAIPESLIDSELFGHEKGAFTGAMAQKRGRFERAHEGTIFLDEVAELPPQAQVRLLRVLQEKEIERVGGAQSIKIDIRVISATHRDLPKLVEEGAFREDLFYRLNVFPIRIPPLRERRADIPALIEHFIREKSREMGLAVIPSLTPGTIDRLLGYNWPGNVREVANAVEKTLIQSDGKSLDFPDIPAQGAPIVATTKQSALSPGFPLTLEKVEANHIKEVLKMTAGRVEGPGGAAELLGINPGTLRHRMRKLKIPFGRSQKMSGVKNP